MVSRRPVRHYPHEIVLSFLFAVLFVDYVEVRLLRQPDSVKYCLFIMGKRFVLLLENLVNLYSIIDILPRQTRALPVI